MTSIRSTSSSTSPLRSPPHSVAIPSARLAYTYTEPGYPPTEFLHRATIPLDPPKEDEITVEVHAAALNPVDIQLINSSPLSLWSWLWGGGAKPQKGIGEDFSGTVLRAGSAVGISHPHLSPGTPVFGLRFDLGSPQGCLSTHVTFSPRRNPCILPLPSQLTHVQGASLPLTWLTSYTALVDYGLLDSRETARNKSMSVAVIGASGGTGIHGIQIAARVLGAGTVVGVCSGKNESFVRELGAHDVVDYTKENPLEGLRRLRPEGGWDVIYDCVGGTETVAHMGELLKRSGCFVTIVGDKHSRSDMGGAATNSTSPRQLLRTFLGWLGLRPRYNCINLAAKPSFFEPLLHFFSNSNESSKLAVPIDSVHPFTDEGVRAAFERLDTGRARGKIVVSIKED